MLRLIYNNKVPYLSKHKFLDLTTLVDPLVVPSSGMPLKNIFGVQMIKNTTSKVIEPNIF